MEYYYEAFYTTCLQAGAQAAYKSSKVLPDILARVYGLSVTVKPNPASEWAAFDYTLPENTADAVLTIYDAYGKKVETFTLTSRQGQKIWDTRQLPAGIYFYSLKAGASYRTDKIIVKK
ncbi:MAG TPA: T9SS type A sorting domain-containing protein [Bacteroidales bacterium]|jgi:hypothetical protein|nr:T9SS type A sorting domain-containing protein [Bacteroidales bacterium]